MSESTSTLAALEADDSISAAVLRLEQFPSLGEPGRIDGAREPLFINTK